ncbi:ABC transporter ATP-binding protein [Paenibacillus sp. PDC88]|uniref:ATP-binding cassette domain-containing protein n=1 Tax=Paenibacillus sp. PDC88 TaxID=1884375 RepID=UPI00089D317D|nr:ABC transporter ATP-binding protein [Paenibacillus sp. PDC88]SDX34032.1 ABC-2 type transport system ATP-binding protein [Paenibacillus sp. PDC88]
MGELLNINDLSIWYRKGSPVIKDLSLRLERNKVVGLIGLNGAGKSTLINTLSGVHKEYKGGVDFTNLTFKSSRYTVFSEDASFQYYTFNEYLSHAFTAYGKTVDKAVVDELTGGFGFNEYRRVLIRDLSTGNRRKVFLITGFALRLPLLMLDEPVNGLDFQSTEYLYSLINAYRQHGTIMFSSHVLESICLTADHVLVLENGAISREFFQGQIDAEKIREALNDTDS